MRNVKNHDKVDFCLTNFVFEEDIWKWKIKFCVKIIIQKIKIGQLTSINTRETLDAQLHPVRHHPFYFT